MFVLASLMALAAAGAALDLTTSSHDPDEDDGDAFEPALGDDDVPRIGDVSPDAEEGGEEPLDWPKPDPLPDATEPVISLPNPERPLGDDLIDGSAEDDELQGGTGNDTIFAGEGNDWVQGDGTFDPSGWDEIHGGAGDDSLAGQGGDDLVWGDEGDDTIQGGEGNDTLFGGAGNDWVAGHDGDDVLIAGGGGDDLDGGQGNDLLVGDDDPRTVWMHGGEGNDSLMPGAGDFVEGQGGADQFVLRQPGGGLPVIADFDAREDQLILHLPASLAQDAQIDLAPDGDGTVLVTVNGDPIARMLQGGGLAAGDILVVRLPG